MVTIGWLWARLWAASRGKNEIILSPARVLDLLRHARRERDERGEEHA